MSSTPHDRPAAPRVPADDAAAAPSGAGPVPGGAPRDSRGHAPAEHTGADLDRQPGPVGGARRTAGADVAGTEPAGAGRAASSAEDTSPGAGTGAREVTGSHEPVVDPALDTPAKRGVSGTVWAALVVGAVVLILLLVFILQNNVNTQFEFLAWTFSLPLGVAMLLSAIAGALIIALVGSVRMFTLGHRLRKLEKERERIKHTLGS